MDEPRFSNKDRIDALNKQLYMKDETKIRKTHMGTIHGEKFDVSKEWSVKDDVPLIDREPKIKPSMFKKFFIGSIIFFVLAAGFAMIKIFGGSNTVSNDNIEIAILGNSFTPGGEELPLQIEIKNDNAVQLTFATLRIEYPKGSGDDVGGSVERKNISLGTVDAHKTITEDLRLTLFGEQGSSRNIKTTLEYRIPNSNAIYVKEKSYVVVISSAPITLTVSSPTSVSANQDIIIDLKTTLNAPVPAPHTILKVTYPPGFQYKESTPKPILGNNVWALDNLKQGVETKISIKGSLLGADGEERSIHAYVGEQDTKDENNVAVVYNSLLQTIKIEKPFIDAHLTINGIDSEEYSVGQGVIRADIEWTNNLTTRVDNLEIYAKFSGSSFDKATVVPVSGFYDSLNTQVIWDRNTVSDFSSVEPGKSGKVSFSFTPLPTYNGNSAISNPQVMIDISIKGQQPALGNTFTQVNNFVHKVVKINSDFQLASYARYHTGPFTNTGPIPPKAEQPTTYTITWSLTNSANRIASAEVKTTLPPGVTWMNSVSPAGSTVTYDNGSRTVVWKAGVIPAGTGLTGAPKEVSFQVRLIPSITQIGSVAPLIDKTILTGQDTFTGTLLQSVKNGLNTRLSNDPNFTNNEATVVQ